MKWAKRFSTTIGRHIRDGLIQLILRLYKFNPFIFTLSAIVIIFAFIVGAIAGVVGLMAQLLGVWGVLGVFFVSWMLFFIFWRAGE